MVRVDDESYVDLSDVVADFDEAFFDGGGLDRIRPIVAERTAAGQVTRFAGERIGAPIARPHQILCIGLNYRDHAAETGQAVPDEPILFTKSPNTLIGPDDDVRIPRGSTKPDWEVELGVVIGSAHQLPGVRSRGPRRHCGLARGQRRERASIPVGARRAVGQGQVRRDLQPGRSVAGHAGRDRRRPVPGDVARRQWRTPADRKHEDDGLRPVLPRALPQPVPRPASQAT